MSDEIVSYEQLLQSLLITNKAYKELKAENERLRGKLRKAIDYVNMQGHHNMSCRYKITYYQWENAEPCDCSIKEFIEEITP